VYEVRNIDTASVMVRVEVGVKEGLGLMVKGVWIEVSATNLDD
jgi:hypothetical protein